MRISIAAGAAVALAVACGGGAEPVEPAAVEVTAPSGPVDLPDASVHDEPQHEQATVNTDPPGPQVVPRITTTGTPTVVSVVDVVTLETPAGDDDSGTESDSHDQGAIVPASSGTK